MNTVINIRPKTNMLSVLQHLNYKPWFALAELVDNALASFLQSDDNNAASETLHVSIQIDSQRILVSDNANGIRVEDFPRAFRAAEVPPDRSGLSEFGMGMKSSASWFGNTWTVRTSIRDEPVVRTVRFDLEQILSTETETIDVQEGYAPAGQHFTVIEITDLNRVLYGKSIAKIKSHLASIYRVFLRSGLLRITFGNEDLVFSEVAVLVAPDVTNHRGESISWRKDIALNLGAGRRVTGFVGIRERGSTREAGLALFRRNRLIMGSGDDTYRPQLIFRHTTSFEYQRLFGELHLHGFSVSHTKDGFIWDEYEDVFQEQLLRIMSAAPLNLIEQAQNYRVKSPPSMTDRVQVELVLDQVNQDIATGLPSVVENQPEIEIFGHIPDALGAIEPSRDTEFPEAVTSTVTVSTVYGPWNVIVEGTYDARDDDWLYVGSEDRSGEVTGRGVNLQLRLNMLHPFSLKYAGAALENVEVLFSSAACIAIALALAKRQGLAGEFVLGNLNEILRETYG